MSATSNKPIEPKVTESDQAVNSQMEFLHQVKPFLRHCISIHHDLNNPLAGILGYTEFLLTEPDKLAPTLKKDLEQINKCAIKMRDIIAQVADAKAELVDKVGPEVITQFLKND